MRRVCLSCQFLGRSHLGAVGLSYASAMNTMAFQALRALSDGAFHSGEDIARTLGVTRSAVWYGIRGIAGAGFKVESVRGRGYRLTQPLSLLDRDGVCLALGSAADRITLEISDMLDSTNTQLMRRAERGAPSGLAVAAEAQTAGRGRRGRVWYSAIGSALTFSLLWRFNQGARELAGLSLATGVALVRALRATGAHDVRLKWPNDVVCRRAKLAGILIEMQGDMLGPSAAVIGIGVNVRADTRLSVSVEQPVANLEKIRGVPVDRNELLALLLAELVAVLDIFSARGFAPLREEWQRLHAQQDREVVLLMPEGRTLTGVARGVADDGALLLETPDGVSRHHGGEITLREGGADT